MPSESRTLRAADLAPFAAGWDRLVMAREDQSDVYDCHGWLAAWLSIVDSEVREALRCPAVLEGDRLRCVLPLVQQKPQKFVHAGAGSRPRFRLVAEGCIPERDTVRALADQLRAEGARELTLLAMPSRDPGTGLLIEALRAAGFDVQTRDGKRECLTTVEGDWSSHRARFKKYRRTVQNFSNKIERIGASDVRSFVGAEAERNFSIYADLHAQGWKGELKPTTRAHREALMGWAGELGLSRLHVLSVADVPAAAVIWFRVGSVAIAYSTVYDRRMTALSAGTIAIWRAMQFEFTPHAPQVVDLLPGRGAQKDQLGLEKPALVNVQATRGRPFAALAAKFVQGGRALLRKTAAGRETSGPSVEGETTPVAVEEQRYAPSGAATEEFTCSRPDDLLLAISGSHPSIRAMKQTWQDGDEWVSLATHKACARLAAEKDGVRVVREIVQSPEGLPENEHALVQALADALDQTLVCYREVPSGGQQAEPTKVSRSPIPWPGSLA